MWVEEKEKRKDFDKIDFDNPSDLNEVAKYNEIDVKVTFYLAKLVHRLFTNEPKTLPRYAIEQFVSRGEDTVGFKFPNENVRLKVLHALLYLYKGGIFETLRAGVFSNVVKYDVNSLYPYSMSLLPQLEFMEVVEGFEPNNDKLIENGKFNEDADALYIYYFRKFKGEQLLPFKHVKSGQKKLLLIKSGLENSVFDFELDYNKMFYKPDLTIKFRIKRHKIFEDKIKRIYAIRKEKKKAKDPTEKVFKLILNSSYGKFGERLGGNSAFFNLIYASMITAIGRSIITSFNYYNPITILTDSIAVQKELPTETIGDELGQFKHEGEGDLFIIGNGLYVLEDPHEKMVKTRGFSISPTEGERIIKTLAEKLADGLYEIEEVLVSVMLKNVSTINVSLEYQFLNDVIIGMLGHEIKILRPLNDKRKYYYHNGQWEGVPFEDLNEYEKVHKVFNKLVLKQGRDLVNEVKRIDVDTYKLFVDEGLIRERKSKK